MTTEAQSVSGMKPIFIFEFMSVEPVLFFLQELSSVEEIAAKLPAARAVPIKLRLFIRDSPLSGELAMSDKL
jgi:hypothetical protein